MGAKVGGKNMKKLKLLKVFSAIFTLALTLSLIPANVTYAEPTCCDRPRVIWERKGDHRTDTTTERFSCAANCKVVHSCRVTKKYGKYWKLCKNCNTYWTSEIRLESTNHDVPMRCHP